jgi:two-component system response regulator FlrC
LLLDEVGEMDPRLQAKLLRVLQEKEIDRVGGTTPIHLDVRVIATTNRNLNERVKDQTFREDLYYRLQVIPLTIPPLRERKSDIPQLVIHFCGRFGSNGGVRRFSEEALDLLMKYDWPGNVRELENLVRRVTALCRNPVVAPSDLFLDLANDQPKNEEFKAGMSLRELEKRMIQLTLNETGGNRTHAARMLGISLRTLRNKLRDYREEENAGLASGREVT